MKRHRQHREAHRRQGLISPALMVALLVVAGCMALVFDQIWVANARHELQAAAEAAALAAAVDLANDSLLLAGTDDESWANDTSVTRKVAANIAGRNMAGGNPIRVDPHRPDEIRIGRMIVDRDTGGEEFLETDYSPSHVFIVANCDRVHGNPVSLFFPYVTGWAEADVRASAAATINNDVVGVRPLAHGNVPAWPLAVLESHALAERRDTWVAQIEEHEGSDRFRFDAATGRVLEEGDGLPEILVRCRSQESTGNLRLVDLGNGLLDASLQRQFEQGLSRDDLEGFDHELRFDDGPYSLVATNDCSGPVFDWLSAQVGQKRIILLYQEVEPPTNSPFQRIAATRLVCARLMQVTATDDGIELVLQPAVIATRTALIPDEIDTNRHEPRNPYIYRLSLTR